MLVAFILHLYSIVCSSSGSQHDYQKGKLPELIDVIIDEKAALFVCAVGIPPKWVVEKLHAAGIPVMNVRFISECMELSRLDSDSCAFHRWSGTRSTLPERWTWAWT